MSHLFSVKCEIEWVFLVSGVPLTLDPSPQKFRVSLMKLDSVIVRIYGERGASMEQRDSEVSAIGLLAHRHSLLDLFATNVGGGAFTEDREGRKAEVD